MTDFHKQLLFLSGHLSPGGVAQTLMPWPHSKRLGFFQLRLESCLPRCFGRTRGLGELDGLAFPVSPGCVGKWCAPEPCRLWLVKFKGSAVARTDGITLHSNCSPRVGFVPVVSRSYFGFFFTLGAASYPVMKSQICWRGAFLLLCRTPVSGFFLHPQGIRFPGQSWSTCCSMGNSCGR